jgi:hypothetical protein
MKMKIPLNDWIRCLFLLGLLAAQQQAAHASVTNTTTTTTAAGEEATCTWEDRESCAALYRDPNLKPMFVNLGGPEEEETTFHAYISPDVATFYNATPGSKPTVEPLFVGLFGKFINLSPEPIRVYWQHGDLKQTPSYISDISAFGAAGTATYPGHIFLVTTKDEKNPSLKTSLIKWTIVKENSLYIYNPIGSIEEASKTLSAEDLELYKIQHRNLAFNGVYKRFTKRQWISLYGRKYPPRHFMWPADSFGQTHSVTTKETHITTLPPTEKMSKIGYYGATETERALLQEYRAPADSELNLTLKVLSVSPRVFEIQNFLSEAEAHHILELGAGMKLSQSTTRAGSVASAQANDATRTSRNSWVSREQSPIVDVIFRRAADLLQINEALLRYRHSNETMGIPESKGPISERLQLVHYAKRQQYTPHHVSFLKNNTVVFLSLGCGVLRVACMYTLAHISALSSLSFV